MGSGFEGFEKRLEVAFRQTGTLSGSTEMAMATAMGVTSLRQLSRAELDRVLREAECTIVSEQHGPHLDSYILSESSLFVFPAKIVLKTCGTTQLLKAIPTLLLLAEERLSLEPTRCKYTRGSFIFPNAQPYPHTGFVHEVDYLDSFFAHLSHREAFVLAGPDSPASASHNWHVYTAGSPLITVPSKPVYTLEMCMTRLDRGCASRFLNEAGAKTGREMTEAAGIDKVLPDSTICDFSFSPCGYSMNGVEKDAVSTIHVTPEDTHSYASFEAMGYPPQSTDLNAVVNRALACFMPAAFVVSVHAIVPEDGSAATMATTTWDQPITPLGYTCRSSTRQELSSHEALVFHVFHKTAEEWVTRDSAVGAQPLFLKPPQ